MAVYHSALHDCISFCIVIRAFDILLHHLSKSLDRFRLELKPEIVVIEVRVVEIVLNYTKVSYGLKFVYKFYVSPSTTYPHYQQNHNTRNAQDCIRSSDIFNIMYNFGPYLYESRSFRCYA